MKKLLRKRSMLLVALLVGLCMPAMADEISKSFKGSSVSATGIFNSVISYETSGGTPGKSYFAISSGGQLQIKCSSGYAIQSIVVTFSGGSYVGGTKTITTSPSNYTGTSSGTTTYTINIPNYATSVSLTGTKNMRITDIKVIYNKLVTPTATLAAAASTLVVGGTTQLNVTTNSDGATTYSSSNTSVATVDANGLITAKGAGTATITANIAASSNYTATSASIQITVNAAPTTPDTEEPEVLDGYGTTVYYIRNVSTGLYIKYGGSYGMDAIEGRAAHPFKLYSKGNNIYSLASIHGYFNSMYSNASLFIDRPESESNWTFELVENTSDVYYLRGENGYALASVGNQYGILELRKYDTKDIYQKWQLITEDKLFAEMQGATVADPVDITPFIKGAAFDYADHVIVTNKETAENAGDDRFFYNEIYDLAGNTWNSTPVASRVVGDGWGTEDAERSEWELTHTYSNNWDGFQRMQHYSAMWSDDQYAPSNMNLNGIGLSRNNIHNEYVIEQYIGELPAGTYTFSYQGLYHVRRGAWLGLTSTSHSVDNNEIPTISIEIPTSETTSTTLESQQFKNYTMSHEVVTSSRANRGYEVATMFRDNRENDSYRNSIEFTLTEEQPVVIRIRKPSTDAEYSGYRLQWLLAFDDFTLIYKGNGSTVIDQAILYYDRVKAAYEYYSKKVSELGEPASYTGCHLDGCVHWTAWDNAINGVVTVNGLNLRGNEYTTPSQKFAYLNGTAASNKIDTEKEFLEALSKIEAAYQAALKEHNSHLTDFTSLIGNPSFEVMEGYGTHDWTEGSATLTEVLIPSWYSIQCRWYWDGYTNNNYSGQDRNAVMDAGSLNCHDAKFFNSWNGVHGKEAHPIQQEIVITEPGLYELSALVSSYAKGDDAWDNGGAITDYTVFLTAGTYHSGVVPHSKDNFVEHKLLFLVEEDNSKINVGAVGGDGDNFNYYDPRGGGFFRADNFTLTKVSDIANGRVKLALDEVKKTALDQYGQELINLSEYENMVNNSLVTGDGTAVVNQLYAQMKEATLAQKTKNADMTWAISNANFELGEAGWTFSKVGDTGVFLHDRAKPSVGADGRYLFNTWNGDAHESIKEITQTITGLRNGTYRLSAMVASHGDNKLTIKAGTASSEVTCVGADRMVEASCEFTVTGGPEQKIVIGVYNNNSVWYKADNFRLTFLHNKLALDHTKDETATVKADWYTDVDLLRPVATGKWHSFVVPYSMPVPENWDVRELTNGTIDETGTHLYMVFNRVTEMVAGTPYMVRYYPQGVPADVDLDVNTDSDTSNDDDLTKQQTNIITEYVDVNLSTPATSGEKTVTGNPAETSTLEFVGSYVPTDIPEGAIFISNNKFYVSKGTSKINGYRGYIVPKGAAANVRTLGMRTRGGQSTDIESANNEEATVVGIYDINGMLLNEMQDGLNILRMSDGTTIKIMMK